MGGNALKVITCVLQVHHHGVTEVLTGSGKLCAAQSILPRETKAGPVAGLVRLIGEGPFERRTFSKSPEG